MTGAKVRFTSNQISLLALGLSILSSGFGVYQWWSSGREEHIRAAIDLSDRYIDQAVTADFIMNQYKSGTANISDLEPVKRQYARIAYISFLSNLGLVNADYLAQRTICDIIKAADRENNPEAYQFKKDHPKSCAAEPSTTDEAPPAKSN